MYMASMRKKSRSRRPCGDPRRDERARSHGQGANDELSLEEPLIRTSRHGDWTIRHAGVVQGITTSKTERSTGTYVATMKVKEAIIIPALSRTERIPWATAVLLETWAPRA